MLVSLREKRAGRTGENGSSANFPISFTFIKQSKTDEGHAFVLSIVPVSELETFSSLVRRLKKEHNEFFIFPRERVEAKRKGLAGMTFVFSSGIFLSTSQIKARDEEFTCQKVFDMSRQYVNESPNQSIDVRIVIIDYPVADSDDETCEIEI